MLISVFRTLILYTFIIFLVRIMGKRQISQLQTSELVVMLLISDIASIPMENTAKPMLTGLVPIVILVACEIVISVIMMKRSAFRRLVCGKPVIIIKDGVIDQAAMKRLRLSTEELYEQLRQGDVFSIGDVSYAIVETNGKMSILKKPGRENATLDSLNIPANDNGIEVTIISDGELAPSSCALYGITKSDITKELSSKGLNIKDVYIMTSDKNKNYNIIKKEEIGK